MVKLRDIIAFTLLSAGSPLASYANGEDDSTVVITPVIDTLKICEAYFPGIGMGFILICLIMKSQALILIYELYS